MSWLQTFQLATEGLESPRQYFYWAGLATISAIVKRKVWLDRDGAYVLYPNIYVILVGKSGLRKGIPVDLSRKLVEMVGNNRVFHGRASVQGIVKELATIRSREDGSPINDSCGYLVSGEFASFLVQDPIALTMLTDLYDCHYNDSWESYLKGTATEKLTDVSLSMLAASNQVHLKDSIQANAVGGGFVARTFFILAHKRQNLNSLIRKTGRKIDREFLVQHLFALAGVEGEMQTTDGAKDVYETWYNEYNAEEKDDQTGMAERIGDHVLKVAMLHSLSRSTDLVITGNDMQAGIRDCMALTRYLDQAMVGQPDEAEYAAQAKLLMYELIGDGSFKPVSKTKFLTNYWGRCNSTELENVVQSLMEAGILDAFKTEDGEVYFELSDKMKARYREEANA